MQNETGKSKSVLMYNPQLDGLRFGAIFFVVCYHWIPWVHHNEVAVFLGGFINFFFVLSSYLITRILISAREKGESLDIARPKVMLVFLLRRTVRIFPAYYLLLLLLILVPAFGSEVKDNTGWYFSYLANYHMFSVQDFSSITAHIWTLAVEEQFYIVWPVVILFVPREHLLKTFVFLIAATTIGRAFFYVPTKGIPMAILTQYCVDAFAVGAVMAYKYTLATEKEQAMISKGFKIGLYAGIPVCAAIIFFRSYYWSFVLNRLLFSVISYAIVDGAVRQYKNYFGKFLENKRVRYIGQISYGIYLYHLIIPTAFWKLYHVVFEYFRSHYAGFYIAHQETIWSFERFIASPLVCFFMYSVLVLIVASLSAKYIEGPLNKLKVGYTAKQRQAALKPGTVAE